MAERTRTHVVYCKLTAAEREELRAIQRELGLPVHALLMIGARHARQVWEVERQHQEEP